MITTMNTFESEYEKQLYQEYKDLQKLQLDPAMKDILEISYLPRIGRQVYRSILEESHGLNPVEYKVKYTMPMYVSPGVLKKDWSGAILFKVTESVLMQGGDLGVRIEGGSFPEGSVPFNKHIQPGWICSGDMWKNAMDGYGIWYFVISIGCLLNLEPDEQAETGDHLNGEAREFFETVRHKQPTNNINWPYKLRERRFTIVPTKVVKPKYTIRPLV